MSQKLEIWIIAQNWMTMNENVKKEKKNVPCFYNGLKSIK